MFDMHVEYARPVGSTQKFGDVAVDVHDDHVAVTEIGRPPDNYFDAHLIGSLADAYEWAEAQAGARAVVLCSAGKHFCAGADFTGRSQQAGSAQAGSQQAGSAQAGPAQAGPAGAGHYAGDLYAQAARLFRARLPVVAAIQGAAVGGGLGLACSADFRVASPAARFSANFARLGFHHGFGLTATLPAIVGQQHALDLLYTGRRVRGEEAARMGLCDRLVAAVELREAARALAAEIAASAPLAVRAIRGTMRAGLADRVRAATDREATEQDRLRQTRDWQEGVRASAERREPRFEGR
jgi:2-(1,2-epoxy-1,2-dihydrophenyl)acetyl-CoA isomerase